MEPRTKSRLIFLTKIAILPAAIGLGESASAAEPDTDSTIELRQTFPKAKINAPAGKVVRILGQPLVNGNTPGESVDAFVARAAKGLSAAPADLRRADLDNQKVQSLNDGDGTGLMYDRATGKYKFYLFRHTQARNNVPVFHAELRTMVKNEPGYPVVWASSTLRDLQAFVPPATTAAVVVDEVKARAAIAAYAKGNGKKLDLPSTFARIGKPDSVIFAGAEDRQDAPRMAVQYTIEDGTPSVAVARFVADANTGEILHAESLLHPIDVGGTVHAMSTQGPNAYDPSDANCEPIVSRPLPYAEVSIQGDPTPGYTSNTGFYYLPHTGSTAVIVNSPIQGQWFSIADIATTVESLNLTVLPPNPANFLHNAANTSEYIRAQGMAYLHANRVRDFLLGYLPGYPGVSTTTSFPITVNYAALPGGWSCPNALGGTGGILFCRQVPTGKNTAFGSVIYHEYGHAIVGYAGTATGSYNEGMSDAISTALDELPGAFYGWGSNNCLTPLRTVQNDCQYSPTTCTTNCGSGSHACGRLISGVIFDIRERLKVTHPSDYRDILNPIMFSSIPLSSGSAINENILDDFLALDDDNGNLADGTPHRAEICGGFNQHGITNSNCPVVAPTNPCGGICANPTVFSWSGSHWSGELGTGSICRETTQTINGGNCGNLTGGRQLFVNGQAMTCNNQNWSSVPAKVNNGYCITTTPGNHSYAYFQVW